MQVAILNPNGSSFGYIQNPYTVTDDDHAPILFAVRPRPFNGLDVYAQQDLVPRGQNPANLYADTYTFLPGALVFESGKPDQGGGGGVVRKLSSAQVLFQNAKGDDDQATDHDTEMWVYLMDSANRAAASYVEINTWVGGGVPTLGANYPQGIAPNSQTPYGMRVSSNSSEAEIKGGAGVTIQWKPHGNDKWTTTVHLVLGWDNGEATTTTGVRYDLGEGQTTQTWPVAWP